MSDNYKSLVYHNNKENSMRRKSAHAALTASKRNPLGLSSQNRKKKYESCMWLFRLETGVAINFFLDFIAIIAMMCTCNIALDKRFSITKVSQTRDQQLVREKTGGNFFLFNFLTDYILFAVLFVKFIYAVLFAKNLFFPGGMDEEFLMDKYGVEKWENRVLSRQRYNLQNYYLVSVMYQRFSFIQSISLLWIFYNTILMRIKIIIFLFYSLLNYVYLLRKQEQLLNQMNEQIKDFYTIQAQLEEQDREEEEREAQLYGNQSDAVQERPRHQSEDLRKRKRQSSGNRVEFSRRLSLEDAQSQ